MERWMISEVWRELKHVTRELGSLVMTLLPWVPIFGLATWGVARLGWQAAPVIVLLTPWFRWLLRGGKLPMRRVRDVAMWLFVAGVSGLSLHYTQVSWPSYVTGPLLVLASLLVQSTR